MRLPVESTSPKSHGLSSLSLLKKGLLLIAIPLICQVVFLSVLGFILVKENTEKTRARRAEAIVSASTRLLDRYYAAGRSLFAYSATKSPIFESNFNAAVTEIPKVVAALEELVKGNQHESELVARIKVIDQRVEGILVESKTSIDYGGPINVFLEKDQLDSEFQSLLLPLSTLVRELTEQEDVATKHNEALDYWSNAVRTFIWIGVPLDILVSISLAFLVYRNTASRLKVLMDNSTRLALHEGLNPPLQGDDEIASVDRTFHATAKSLEQVNQVKRDFVNMISHDLRTPLSTVQLQIDLLLDTSSGSDPRADNILTSASKQIERILGLANQLVDLEQVSIGRYELKVAEIPLNRLICEARDSVKQLASKLGISIEVPETTIHVMADEYRLEQVLLNLLSNALKCSTRGSTITLAAELTDAGGMVKVDVIDEDQDIQPGSEESMFERSLLPRTSDSPKEKTKDLGLFISKSIIEAHGGTITAKRNDTKGATISFTLPTAKGADSDSQPLHAQERLGTLNK